MLRKIFTGTRISQDTLKRVRNNDSELTTLHLAVQELTDEDILILCDALKTNTTLSELRLDNNSISAKGAQALAKNTTLTDLHLSYNNIGDEGAQALAQNTTLRNLFLANCEIGDIGAAALAKNTTLITLFLDCNTHIGAVGAQALAQNTKLHTLFLRYCKMGDIGAAALARTSTLIELDLTMNHISDTGAQALAQNSSLIRLELDSNNISDRGAQALATNFTMFKLSLSNNQIGASGAQALAQNTMLFTLNLSNEGHSLTGYGRNKIGDTGAQALAMNTTLITLELDGNKISDVGAQALARSSTLDRLGLSYNNISDVGAQALARNGTLNSLGLSYNNISEVGAQALAQNTLLTELGMYGLKISEKIRVNNWNALRKNKDKHRERSKALISACKSQNLSQVKLLLQQGVRPYGEYIDNAPQNSTNETFLHLAVRLRNAELLALLLPRNPETSARNADHLTYIELAKQIGFPIATTADYTKPTPAISSASTSSSSSTTSNRPAPAAPNLMNDAGKITLELNIPFKQLKIGKELGRGGFGIVYQAAMGHQDVAVKQLQQKLSSDAFDEFQKETTLMARLRNPKIVQLYGVCIEKDSPLCMVMEFMSNGSLYDFLHGKSPLLWPLCMQMALDMALGLHYLHASQILHRDIKSPNVLLDKNMNAKLTDFGLSKVKKETSSTSTMHHKVVGTALWMAPELMARAPAYSVQSDIFALAITFWELTSRKLPFEDTDNAVVPTLVMNGEREAIPAHCTPGFKSIITRCWAQKANDRPGLDILISELKQMQGNVPASAPGIAAIPAPIHAATPAARPAYQNNIAPPSSSPSYMQQQQPFYQVNNLNSASSGSSNPFNQFNRK